MKNFTAFNAVIQVAQSGNFVQAAEKLGLSAAAISKSIQRLEEELGIKLFQRTTRSVTLTAEGERLVSGLQPLLTELNHLTQEISDSVKEPQGLLRVSMPPNFGRHTFMPIAGEFLKRYPNLNMELSLDSKLSNLIEDKIDVAIRAGALPDNANLVARPIMHTRLRLCASPEYIARFGEPASPENINEHAIVQLRSANSATNSLWRLSDSVTVTPPQARFIVDDFDAMLSAIEQGIGMGRVFDFMCEPKLASGDLVEIFPDLQASAVTLNVIYQDRRLLSVRIRAFIDYLIEQFS